MLKLADLAARPDMRFGPLLISPARRFVNGPEGEVHLEPRVMQVFLLLLDSDGRVVTRNEIFEQCWGAAMVGDDNINRAIAAIRRIPDEVSSGAFEVETIPRTGYRMVWAPEPAAEAGSETDPRGIVTAESTTETSRRKLVLGGAAALAVTSAGGLLWKSSQPRGDPRFEALMERGRDAIRLDEPGSEKFFRQAVVIEPRNAAAWGLLACALGYGQSFGPVPGASATSAERAARTALTLDPEEPNALLAMTLLEILDGVSREERYRRILAIDPSNTLTMRFLGMLLHSVGRCRESLAVSERALAIEPLCPDQQARRAGKLWVLGRVSEADRVINRAMELWPSHRIVRVIRLMIYAFTGRVAAALAMVEEEQAKPVLLPPSAASVWHSSLIAIGEPTASAVASARMALVDGAKRTTAAASWAILALSALGELDAAFEVADGFLLDRGSVIVRPRPESRVPTIDGPGWRNTFGLFVPPTKPMRLDPRFRPLADGLGLSDYWRKRGIGADDFLFKR